MEYRDGARKTKRLLAELIIETVKERVGTEAWDAMSEEERQKKLKVFKGDCWGHLRNIIIKAMSKAGDEFVRASLQDDLHLFSSFERIEPEGGSVIRGAFKCFHHGGEGRALVA